MACREWNSKIGHFLILGILKTEIVLLDQVRCYEGGTPSPHPLLWIPHAEETHQEDFLA